MTFSGENRKHRVEAGEFTSVAVYDDHVYAAQISSSSLFAGKVYVFKYNSKSEQQRHWEKIRVFSVIKGGVTLSVSGHQIKCCSDVKGTIAVYSLDGRLLVKHGKRESGDAGQQKSPTICNNISDDGSVLIADNANHRLHVISEQAEFIELRMKPLVRSPVSAAVLNDRLFVTSKDTRAIYTYA